jgi:ABC-2 type transport system ATP-binding protein
MLGLVRVKGTITIAGHDVARVPELALRSLAYVPQIAPPLDAPVGEVVRAIATLRGIDPERVRARAAELGLRLESSQASRFRDLSGGMKQKLLAALALAAETPVLLCDEPTANLDAPARAAFIEILERLPRDRLVILCSHRVEELQDLVDRTIELRDGVVLSDAACDGAADTSQVRAWPSVERPLQEVS